jgi:hypothetical protein
MVEQLNSTPTKNSIINQSADLSFRESTPINQSSPPRDLFNSSSNMVPKVIISGHANIQPPSRFTRRTNVKLWLKTFDK